MRHSDLILVDDSNYDGFRHNYIPRGNIMRNGEDRILSSVISMHIYFVQRNTMLK
jgi:hypothetical protein